MNSLVKSNSGSNSLARKGMNVYKRTTPLGKVVFFVILILLIIFIVYVIYIAVKASRDAYALNPIIVNDVIDANIARPAFNLPQVTDGMSHSFSTWIYVKDWNYKFGQYKNILWKGTNGGSGSPGSGATTSSVHCPSLWLYPLTNSLKVVTSTSVAESVESCDIQNIPLMTWVNIVYVLNNRTVDIYINGKLERSCALRGIPTITNDPVFITSGSPQAGFYGKISKTQYFTKALLPNEVANIYQQGPLGTTQYQVNFFTNGKLIDISDASSFANSS